MNQAKQVLVPLRDVYCFSTIASLYKCNSLLLPVILNHLFYLFSALGLSVRFYNLIIVFIMYYFEGF